MHAVVELEKQGYEVKLQYRYIKLEYLGEGKSEPNKVMPLLNDVKLHKDEAVNYLIFRDNDNVDFMEEARMVKESLSQINIAKMNSKVLDEEIYWTQDSREASKAPSGATVYTLDELEELIDLGDNPSRLRRLHEAKKIFLGSKLAGLSQQGVLNNDWE